MTYFGQFVQQKGIVKVVKASVNASELFTVAHVKGTPVLSGFDYPQVARASGRHLFRVKSRHVHMGPSRGAGGGGRDNADSALIRSFRANLPSRVLFADQYRAKSPDMTWDSPP